MMSTNQIEAIIERVFMPGIEFKLGASPLDPDVIWVQARSSRPHAADGRIVEWGGRKWLISRYSTESEIVQTCLKAVLTFYEHEVRELFTYNKRHVFNPHISIETLTGVCTVLDERSNDNSPTQSR